MGVLTHVIGSPLLSPERLAARGEHPPVSQHLLLMERVRGRLPARCLQLGGHMETTGIGFVEGYEQIR